MNLYIADPHFGHSNVIRFDSRPFHDAEEMDKTMIQRWNGRVSSDDDVYILGGFSYRSSHDPSWYLQQLFGKKHLIIGNHDHIMVRDNRAMSYFESIDRLTMIHDVLEDRNISIVLCHYPLASWTGEDWKNATWHFYGHLHGRQDDVSAFMAQKPHAYNAWCGFHGWRPACLQEIVAAKQHTSTPHA